MKKKYVYLLILIIFTVILTLFASNLYKNEVVQTTYLYEKLNKITSAEFEEYMIEHPDTIIYIADKTDLANNKFEKKLINKLEKLNLLDTVIYIEKDQITDVLKKILKDKYSYEYSYESLPVIIVINDGEMVQISVVDKNSNVNNIIDYEVFE